MYGSSSDTSLTLRLVLWTISSFFLLEYPLAINTSRSTTSKSCCDTMNSALETSNNAKVDFGVVMVCKDSGGCVGFLRNVVVEIGMSKKGNLLLFSSSIVTLMF